VRRRVHTGMSTASNALARSRTSIVSTSEAVWTPRPMGTASATAAIAAGAGGVCREKGRGGERAAAQWECRSRAERGTLWLLLSEAA
jgi:hypothetical protein